MFASTCSKLYTNQKAGFRVSLPTKTSSILSQSLPLFLSMEQIRRGRSGSGGGRTMPISRRRASRCCSKKDFSGGAAAVVVEDIVFLTFAEV